MLQWLYLELAVNPSGRVQLHNWQLRSQFPVLGHSNLIIGCEADLSAYLSISEALLEEKDLKVQCVTLSC